VSISKPDCLFFLGEQGKCFANLGRRFNHIY